MGVSAARQTESKVKRRCKELATQHRNIDTRAQTNKSSDRICPHSGSQNSVYVNIIAPHNTTATDRRGTHESRRCGLHARWARGAAQRRHDMHAVTSQGGLRRRTGTAGRAGRLGEQESETCGGDDDDVSSEIP